MKKLVLVISIVALFAIGAFATSYTLTPSLSVSGSYSFGFVLGNQGIDLTNSLSSDLSVSAAWSSNFGTFTQPATWTFDFSLFDWGSTPTISVKSAKYESVVNSLDFETASNRAFSPMFWSNGSAVGLTYVYKPMSALTTQYLDTINDGASTSPSTPLFASPFFKDEVAANYAGSGYAVSAAMYYDATNTNLYSYFAGLNYSGITDLTVDAAFGSDLARTPAPAASEIGTWLPVSAATAPVQQIGVDANYARDFGLTGAGTVSVSAEYKYFSNFTPKYEKFVDTDSDGNADSPEYDVNSNNVYGKASYNNTFGIVTMNPWIWGNYDIAASSPTAGFGIKSSLNLAAGPLTVTPSVDYEANLMPFAATTKTLDVALSTTVNSLSLAGDVNWADMTAFATPTWNAKATYSATPFTLEGYVSSETSGPAYGGYYAQATYAAKMWTYTGFYGTLSTDANGNYTVVNAPYWYIEASATVNF